MQLQVCKQVAKNYINKKACFVFTFQYVFHNDDFNLILILWHCGNASLLNWTMWGHLWSMSFLRSRILGWYPCSNLKRPFQMIVQDVQGQDMKDLVQPHTRGFFSLYV